MTILESIQLDQSNIFLPEYRGRLTEGITYNPANDTLLWVDIIVGEVHRVHLSSSAPDKDHEFIKWKTPGESVGAIALTTKDDVILVCGKTGVALGDFKTGEIEYFFKYPNDEKTQHRLRSNDGIVDPWGHLWIGLMNDFPITAKEGVLPEGKLYRINCNDLSVETMVDGTLIANGLAFSEDHKTLFWTDSLTFTVWKFDYDYETNKLTNKRPHIETKKFYSDFASPEPDGMTMTKDGHIYGAVFSTSSVYHADASGQLLNKIHLPAARITCVISGGKNNDELFITTGHTQLDDPDAAIDSSDKTGDLGGFLFRVKLDSPINGQIKNIWGGKV
ncbi:Gluconolactonase putatively [Scheffersomyces xylosifermentans]|uniref:Gluconolactonase putatively n=1 Tax=Scheffersomyces xylosifermentans TaxID=1304137 RepID=UPI00315D619E